MTDATPTIDETMTSIADEMAIRTNGANEEIRQLRESNQELLEALEECLPYARATIGLPEASWPYDSCILKARAAIEKARAGGGASAEKLHRPTMERVRDGIISRLQNREPTSNAWLAQKLIVETTVLSMMDDG